MTAMTAAAWTATMLLAPYIMAVTAYRLGVKAIDRRMSADAFSEDFTPENIDVAADVTWVDDAMVEAVVARDRWGS